MSTRPRDPAPQRSFDANRESGAILVLTLIVVVLLYAMVWQLTRTAETARLMGENDLLVARMENHMVFSLAQIEDMLAQDLDAAAAGEDAGGAGGGLPGMGGGLPGGAGGGLPGGAGGGEGEEEQDAAAVADGSQDAWYRPTAYSENDITTYVWVEDENRKFNILAMVSPDEEFAEESKQRFIRLIDVLREGTDWDLSQSQGSALAEEILDWMEARTRGEYLPRPKLKSDIEEGARNNITLPLQLDEIRLLAGVTDEVYFDKVFERKVVLGLESVLTVSTSLAYDPGDPDDPANQQQQNQPAGAGAGAGDAGAGGGEGAPAGSGEDVADLEPIGQGIRINVNTAPWPVLRCLFPPAELSDAALEAILRFRNEEVEDTGLEGGDSDYTLYVQDADQVKRKMFTDLSELEELPELQNLPDPTIRDELLELLTVQSDVFSVHMASLYKRNEESRSFVLQRARSILVRVEGDDGAQIHPIVLHERRFGLRVLFEDPVDQRDLSDRASTYGEMDAFSQEEAAWNPFLLDFYRPQYERDELFNYSERLR